MINASLKLENISYCKV